MKYSLYLYGTSNGKYIQFPLDGEETFLHTLCENVDKSILTIKRDKAITYFAFTKMLNTNNTFGICIVTNGIKIENIKLLFDTFSGIYSIIISHGQIIKFDTLGSAQLDDSFVGNKNALKTTISIIDDVIKEKIEKCCNYSKENFTGNISTKDVTINESNADIIKAIEDNNVVNIHSIGFTKIESFDDSILVNKTRTRRCNKIILLITLILLLVSDMGLYLTLKSLKNSKEKLYFSTNKIEKLEDELEEKQSEYSNFRDLVKTVMPIIIKDIDIANTNGYGKIETNYGNTIYSNQSKFLKPRFSYIGIDTDTKITLNIKFIAPYGLSTNSESPEGYSFSKTITVSSGTNTEYLSGWGGEKSGFWSIGSYKIEIWYKNVCLKTKLFKVH